MGLSIIAICLGASLGALMRWALGLWLNALFPAIPPGTLAANLIGAYLVGLALALFVHQVALPAEWRLFIITGFLGGLTTFSSFSLEVVLLLQQGRMALALGAITMHVLGSLLMTFAGLASYELARRMAASG